MTRVAVLFGGRSTEHDVSCRSAASVVQYLDRSHYEVVPVRITTEGGWIVGVDRAASAIDEVSLREMTPEPDGRRLTNVESLFRALETLRQVNVVMPILHGPYGEDGTVQGVLELAGIPYVGSGVLASATSMDKEFTKKILAAEGIAVADGVVLRDDGEVSPDEYEALGLPVFVKPSRGGSSIGVSRVNNWAELPQALEAARLCDTKVLIEAGVPGREINVGVLELPDGRLVVSPPLEIRVSADHGFFDYDAKYREGLAEFVVPDDLDPATVASLNAEAVRVFRTLGCAGLLRIDFFVDPGRSLIVNEVNTVPGFTATSQYPRMWEAAGMEYPELLNLLIETALAGSYRRPALLS